jgi:proline racemase
MAPDEAKALVEANTTLRNKFFEEQLHVSHHDRTLFHAIFNNERASAEVMAETIVAFVKKAWSERAPAP